LREIHATFYGLEHLIYKKNNRQFLLLNLKRIMKVKNLFYYILACTILLTGFTSCNDDDPSELYLEVTSVYIKLGEDANLGIISGNGGYTVKVDDESILTASPNQYVVALSPKSKGKTNITVTDKENKVATATIYVTDPYMAYYVGSPREVYVKAIDTQVASTIKTEVEKNSSLVTKNIYNLSKTPGINSYAVYKEKWGSTPESTGTFSFDAANHTFTLKSGNDEYLYKLDLNNQYAKAFFEYFTKTASPSASVSLDTPDLRDTSLPIFTIENDLTDKYKAQYPEAGVEKVTITAPVQLLPYRAEYVW